MPLPWDPCQKQTLSLSPTGAKTSWTDGKCVCGAGIGGAGGGAGGVGGGGWVGGWGVGGGWGG